MSSNHRRLARFQIALKRSLVFKWIRRRMGRATLVGRLSFAVVATALFVYIAAVAGVWFAGGRVIEDSARKQALQWLAELDEQGTPLYTSREREIAMRTLAARLQKFPEIQSVRYFDVSGKNVFGEYVRGGRESPPVFSEKIRAALQPAPDGSFSYLIESHGGRVRIAGPMLVRTLGQDAPLDLSRVVRRDSGKMIGYIDLEFDARSQYVGFRRSLIGGSAALAIVFCLAAWLGRHAVRRAMAPLTALEEPLARLARGDINVDMGGGGDREIAAIRNALNTTIGALKEREDALRRAESDALTGLVNQRYFERQLVLERSRVERDGESSAVLSIDIDRFGELKGLLGDSDGDRLLGQVAGLLRARIRENDLLARFDDDAFVALVRGVSRDGAVKVARSINQVMQEFQFASGDDIFPITVSIGVAMLDSAHSAAETVMAHAVGACAQANARGGNRHFLHDTEEAATARSSDSPAWSRHVRTAIQDNALKIVYQPIVDLRDSGSGDRYELLLRLVAPGGQLVSPTAFLPVADRFGLITELDYWVVRQACAELARLQTQDRSATFFVNLSGQVFENGDNLIRTVSEALTRHRIDGQHLVFEITEQAAIRQLDQARRVIDELSKLGCRFALDDFGSGFSSLNYLKHLPVSFIKISGAFVQNMLEDALDEVMVRSVVQIADALKMQTVAESVEDKATLLRIAELGVGFAQGYFIARPAERPTMIEGMSSRSQRRLLGQGASVSRVAPSIARDY